MKTIIIGGKPQAEKIISLVKRFYGIETVNMIMDQNSPNLERLNALNKIKACIFELENKEKADRLRNQKERAMFLFISFEWFCNAILTDLDYMTGLYDFIVKKKINCLLSGFDGSVQNIMSKIEFALDNISFVPYITDEMFSHMSIVDFENMFHDSKNSDYVRELVKNYG